MNWFGGGRRWLEAEELMPERGESGFTIGAQRSTEVERRAPGWRSWLRLTLISGSWESLVGLCACPSHSAPLLPSHKILKKKKKDSLIGLDNPLAMVGGQNLLPLKSLAPITVTNPKLFSLRSKSPCAISSWGVEESLGARADWL